MSTVSTNRRKIDKAFGRLISASKDKPFRAISKGTEDGYNYALDIHKKAKHELHLVLGGDFGYMVAQDGVIRNGDIVKGKVVVYATAEKALQAHLEGAPKSGVLGVVSAGMQSATFDDPWEYSALSSAYKRAVARAKRELEK